MLDRTNNREARRQKTINAMLDALERLIIRDGVRNLGINKVAKEAHVSKPQIYSHFGGLPGLIREWGRRRKFWPSHEELLEGDEHLYPDGDPKEQIKRRMIRLGTILRDNPLSLEILAEELIAPSTELTDAFREVRHQRGLSDVDRYRDSHPYLDRENFRLIHVLFAATVYFALRARRNPELQGIWLDTEDGWNDTMKMIEEIVDDSILAAEVRKLIAE